MAKRIVISVPTPCHEKWQDMTPSEKGRHCHVCQKNVRDFTGASDREIAEAIKEPITCGRFMSSQLERELILPQQKSSLWFAVSAAIMGFLALGNNEAIAQTKTPVEQGQATEKVSEKEIASEIIQGVIIDEANLPVPGTMVINKRTCQVIQADFDGKFTIPASKDDILEFKIVGMITTQTIINLTDSSLTVVMKDDQTYNNDVLIGAIVYKRSFLGGIFHSIGNWFR